jgi:N6-adenosine-specific RNA methylase IME4
MQYLICQERKKILQLLPNFIIFFFKKKKQEKQSMQYGNDIICKAKSNLMMPLQKNSRSTYFFCLPQ